MRLRLKLLGDFRAFLGENEVNQLASQPTRAALLVFLAVEGGGTRDEILGVLWPDRDPSSARHALSQNLHRLRRVLGEEWVRIDGERVEITDSVDLDISVFESLLEEGRPGEALDVYEGPFLKGWFFGETTDFESWVDRHRARLERLHRRARREYLEELRKRGDLQESLEIARRWIEIDALEDEAHHQVIALLAGLGRRNEALRQFEVYESILAEEDLEPLADTVELVQGIRRANGPAAPPALPPPPEIRSPLVSVSPEMPNKHYQVRLKILGFLLVIALAVVGLLRLPGWAGLGRSGEIGFLVPGGQLVLADFENATQDSLLALAATEALRVDINGAVRGALLERAEVHTILQRMGHDVEMPLDPRLAREVAIRAGSEAVIEGQVGAVGSGFVLSAEIRVAETGEVVAAFRRTARDQTEIINALGGLSEDLLLALIPSLAASPEQNPLPEVTVSSLSALQKYAQGVRVWDLRADGPTALALLEEAIASDSGFAMAYRKIGIILVSLQLDRERQVWALERAYRNRDRLSDSERFLTSGSFHLALTGDQRAAAAAFRALLELDPDNPGALNNLSRILAHRGEFAEGEELLRKCIEGGNAPPPCWISLAENLYAQRRFAEAWQMLVEAEALFPQNWQVEEMQVYWLTAQGRYVEADSILDTAGEGGGPRLRSARLRARAGLAAVRGRLAEARRYLGSSRLQLEEAVLPEPLCWTSLTEAVFLLEIGRDTAEAIRVADQAASHPHVLTLDPLSRPFLAFSQFYALAGSRESAVAHMQGFLSEVPEVARGPYDPELFQVRGILAAQQGRIREAKDAFLAAAERTGPLWTVRYDAYLHELAGDPDSALLAYEEYLDTPDLRRFDLDQALLGPVLLRVAEIQISMGRTMAAGKTLDRLAELWRAADSGLRERLSSARRALSATSPPT